MRPLTLHASALSDVEYDIYTSSLNDIADGPSDSCAVHDDAHYEQMTIGLREARAWLRGKYSHMPVSTIDAILKFFSPSLGANDSLSGGQFFAAFRLAVHADNGKQVDRALAFVQAHPLSSGSKVPPPSWRHHDTPSKSVSLSFTPIVTQISPAPSTSTHTAAHNPFTALTNPDSNSTHNPLYPQAPPQHPMLRVDPFKSMSQPSYNPFTQKPNDPYTNTSPPLPPRKPPPPVPPSLRHAPPPVSVKCSTSPIHQGAGATPLAGATPAPPPPKPVSHVTSTLIKQSLHASKVAQSLKKAEEQLEKERIMQVLKSSSGVVRNRSSSPDKGPGGYGHITAASSSSRSDSDDRAAPPLPKRRGEHGQSSVLGRPLNPSPPQSTSSFDQIALAGLSPRHETTLAGSVKSDAHGAIERGRSRSHPPSTSERARSEHSYATQTVASLDSHPGSVAASAKSSPARLTTVLPPIPPPTHPDRRERDERDRDKRYGPLSVHSNKSGKSNQMTSSGEGLTTPLRPAQAPTSSQTQGQPLPGHVDTRPFDSVYGALVSAIKAGDNQEDGCTIATCSTYATPAELVQPPPPLPPLLTALPNGMPGPLTPVSPDSPTPTTTKPSPTARVFRSKSMYQPSTPPPVPPPLRRKRPESVQVLSASDSAPASADSGGTMFQELVNKFEGGAGGAGGVDEGDGDGQGTKMLSRHLSLSGPGLGTITKGGRYGGGSRAGLGSSQSPVPSSPHGSSVLRRSSLSHMAVSAPASASSGATHHSHGHHHSIHVHNYNGMVDEHLSLAALQRTFVSLQPKLDKARYKAEAGISRRGFIQGDGEGPDSGGESGGEREGLVRHHSRRRAAMNGHGRVTPEEHEWGATSPGVERDDRKWPVNRIAEGWAPL
ncbi:hypothetical protein APHAL10511_004251 [Amanita phalloides]|nr:hypothetical protein APHAL10511_004251 [Amanita phalloides]